MIPRDKLPLWAVAEVKPDHAMHPHSISAWRTLDLAGRKSEVCAVLERASKPMTDREVCEALGSADMNYARPAITHLIHDGVLEEVGSVACPVTNRTVRTVWFVVRRGEGEAA
jgi:hypothetical protein